MKIIKPLSGGSAIDAVSTNVLISSNIPASGYAMYSSATSYSIGNRVESVNLATDGDLVVHIYESLVNSNLNNSPWLSPSKWLDLGPNNKWAMFDHLVGTQTIYYNNPIVVVISNHAAVDALALLNMSGSSVDVGMTYKGVTVYQKSINLQKTGDVYDWYGYFFGDFSQQTDLVLTDLPLYCNENPAIADSLITVTIHDASGIPAACGNLVLGNLYDLGQTQFNPTLGITDYSLKTADSFGNYTILKRKYSKRMSAKLEVDNDRIDDVFNTLAEYRSTPLVWIGADNQFSSMIVWGFYKDFEVDVAYPTVSYCTLNIEGLT